MDETLTVDDLISILEVIRLEHGGQLPVVMNYDGTFESVSEVVVEDRSGIETAAGHKWGKAVVIW